MNIGPNDIDMLLAKAGIFTPSDWKQGNCILILLSLIGSILSIIAVSLFWGITNPFMKKGVVGLEKVQHASLLAQIGAEIWHLVKNWRVSHLNVCL